ncbi:MAG: hypothetical protein VX475_03230, partial [Myxococcota bacterium]|nr:hypothetical protein [Myxococcota bacterium]
ELFEDRIRQRFFLDGFEGCICVALAHLKSPLSLAQGSAKHHLDSSNPLDKQEVYTTGIMVKTIPPPKT